MEKINLYLFHESFFNDEKAIGQFVSNTIQSVNSKTSDQEKNEEAFAQIILIENLKKSVKKQVSLDYLHIAQANFLVFLGYRKEDIKVLSKSINILNGIDIAKLDNFLHKSYYLVKGETHLHYYNFSIKNEDTRNDSITSLEHLFKAKAHFSLLLNQIFDGQLSLLEDNAQKVIVHYSQVLGHLSRYVEPFYLIDKLEELTSSKFIGSVSLARYVLLDAIREKTCSGTNPLMLIELKKHINKALNSSNVDQRNCANLYSQLDEIDVILTDYEAEHGKSQKQLERILHEGFEQIEKHNQYQKFLIRKRLLLNEHSLYCSCKVAVQDDIQIESTCEHTQVERVKPYQLLLDILKMDFDQARQSYFRATDEKGKSNLYKGTVKTSHSAEGIILSPAISDITSCFNKCFSILDRIALGVNSIYQICEGEEAVKSIHFNSFFRRNDVKKVINESPDNLYLLALYSMSQDLDSNNPELSEFHEYKEWRNAIEHKWFCVTEENVDVSELRKANPNVKYLIRRSEFLNKASYILHFCRSAIFTYVWMMRKASKHW